MEYVAPITCLLLASLYVGSLYVLIPAHVRELPRNHATHIQYRMFAVTLSTIVALFTAIVLLQHSATNNTSAWKELGFHTVNITKACILPSVAFIGLFCGPIVQVLVGQSALSWISLQEDDAAIWINARNLVVASISEEIVFRAIFCTLMSQVGGYSYNVVLYTTPLFFGVAHVHHFVESLKHGDTLKHAFIRATFQMTYTTLFGILQNHVFLSTRHVLAVILTHSFCNLMAFPRIDLVHHHESMAVVSGIVFAYLAGIAWFVLVGWNLITDSSLYT